MKNPKILIVGAGISGLMAAIRLAENGIPISLFSLLPACRSDSLCDRNGISAAINSQNENDSPEKHFAETIVAGDLLANQELVRRMCYEAPNIVNFCHQMGVSFNRTAEGFINFYKSEGERHRRTLFAGESTGKKILMTLDSKVRRYQANNLIERFEGWEFLSLVLDKKGICRGIVAINRKTLELRGFECDAVIFCSGGLGAIFGQSQLSNGSAASILYQQGTIIANGEFIHVSPTVSYSVGGLWVDENHMTSIDGVFAAGECQYQYHGAKPLESNILTSSLVGGAIASNGALNYVLGLTEESSEVSETLFNNEILKQNDKNKEIMEMNGYENPHSLHKELAEWMVKNVLLERNNNDLKKTEEKIKELKDRLSKISITDRGSFMNHELLFVREFWNMLEMASVITRSALMRNESRGCHFKPEFPKRDNDNFLKTTKAFWTSDGPKIEYEDVNFKYLKP